MKMIAWDYGDGVYGKCFWIRIFGYGLHVKKHNSSMLASERYGFTPYRVIFGFKFKYLPKR